MSLKKQFLKALRCVVIPLVLGTQLRAQEPDEKKTPAKSVVTPLTLPGAESFIYHEVAPEPMRLHVFKPEGWKATDQRPVYIHFFGGGFVRGVPTNSAGFAKQAAAWGMIGVAADYRVSSRHKTDATACIADARAAVNWLQTHAKELGLDPRKIVVGGSSAGGHLAIWTAITKTPPGSDPQETPLEKPVALILMWPAADTSSDGKGQRSERFAGHGDACSATQNLDLKMPPSLLLHGDKDPTVPYAIAQELHQKLITTGNTCEFITMTGCGHGATVPEWKAKLPALMEKFLTDQKILPVGK
ncbi:alpha/beta hydrolase [Oleiharenicola lentus]|uniref:alpha/beta hydrolase n=1 Tax=Oleiharenicola lentus TaxID=2508720 RepID=UPI003F67987D